MTARDVARPPGDDAPWSNDLEDTEDGSRTSIGVPQLNLQGDVVDADGNLPSEVLREDLAQALGELE